MLPFPPSLYFLSFSHRPLLLYQTPHTCSVSRPVADNSPTFPERHNDSSHRSILFMSTELIEILEKKKYASKISHVLSPQPLFFLLSNLFLLISTYNDSWVPFFSLLSYPSSNLQCNLVKRFEAHSPFNSACMFIDQ